MLQAGRLWVWFPIRSLHVFNVPNDSISKTALVVPVIEPGPMDL
jgi:hypothetical protein